MQMDPVSQVLGYILLAHILVGPWIMIPSWAMTRDAMGTIAKNCGIRHAWLTWIPCVNIWVQGSISDHWRMTARNQKKSGRRVMLAMRILQLLLWAVFGCFVAGGIQDAIAILEEGASQSIAKLMVVYAIVDGLWFFFPALILGLVNHVRKQMALYDIFAAFAPEKRVLYLVLSVFPVVKLIAKPLCLRACRDGELSQTVGAEEGENGILCSDYPGC